MKKLKKMKNAINLVLCFAMLISVIQIAPQNVYADKKIKLSKTKVILYVGEKDYLDLYDGKNQVLGLKWTSSNKKVATVDSVGHIKALKAGTTKITVKYKKKKYICKVTVKDALKNHVSYELIDIPENKELDRNNYKAIKIMNDNDAAIKIFFNCKRYDENEFFLREETICYTVNANDYIIAPILYNEHIKMKMERVNKANSIDIEYNISDSYIDNENHRECRDIIFTSKKSESASYSILYYNGNNELILINNNGVYVPANERVKKTISYPIELKDEYDIQRIEIFFN